MKTKYITKYKKRLYKKDLNLDTDVATEKPMDKWEERFRNEFPIDIAFVTKKNRHERIINFIKDLLEEEPKHNTYKYWFQRGIKAEQRKGVIGKLPIPLWSQTKAVAEYKQKLIQRIEGMKHIIPFPEALEKYDRQSKLLAEGFNEALDEVEAVIRE